MVNIAAMKTLREYLDSLPIGGVQALAEKMGIKSTYLCRLASGDRRITGEWSVKIHRATDGEMPSWELRPDLYDPPAESVSGQKAA